jgi:hypothetical protein
MPSPFISRAIAGGLIGAGASEAENQALLGHMSPEMHRINNLIGAATGAVLGGHGLKSQIGAGAAAAWPFKTMGLVGTGLGQEYIDTQQAMMDKKLMTAILEAQTAERQNKYLGMNNIPALLTSLAALGGAGGLGYYLYKKYGPKKRKKPGETTLKGTPNRRRQKVKIDVPAESLPPEFFRSLVNVDDMDDALMKANPEIIDLAKEVTKGNKKAASVLGYFKAAGMANTPTINPGAMTQGLDTTSPFLQSSDFKVNGPMSLAANQAVEPEDDGKLQDAQMQAEQSAQDLQNAQQETQQIQSDMQHQIQLKEMETEQMKNMMEQQISLKENELKAKEQEMKALEKELSAREKAQQAELTAAKSEHEAVVSASKAEQAATMSTMLDRVTSKVESIKGNSKVAAFAGYLKEARDDMSKLENYIKMVEEENRAAVEKPHKWWTQMSPWEQGFYPTRLDPESLDIMKNRPEAWKGTWQDSLGRALLGAFSSKVHPTATFPQGGVNQSVQSRMLQQFGQGLTGGGMNQFRMLTPGYV